MAYQSSVIIWKRNLAASVAVMALLAGCGGSGGTLPSRDEILQNQTTAPHVAAAMGRAAAAEPNAGSVTQSSNVGTDGITTDQVEVTAEFGSNGPVFSIQNGTEWEIAMGEGNPEPILDMDTGDALSGVELTKRLEDGTLYVVAYANISDIEEPETPGGSTTPDPDYFAGGYWVIVPDDAASAADYAFGAFVDATEPFDPDNLAALEDTATYLGGAGGVYSDQEDDTTTIGDFEADVILWADFGDSRELGTISGDITNFVVDGEPEPGMLALGKAAIGSTNSGVFTGAVTGSDDEHDYTGNWGGQFNKAYEFTGDDPQMIVGTFGASSLDNTLNAVGVFVADWQPPQPPQSLSSQSLPQPSQ